MNFSHDVVFTTEMQEALEGLKETLKKDDGLKPEQYSERDLSLLYHLGYRLYHVGDYKNAKEVFRRLCIARPFEEKHWQSLASTQHVLAEYEDALLAWGMCVLINDKDPLFHTYAADSLLHLNRKEQAREALEQAAKTITEEHPIYPKFFALKEGING